MIDLFALDNHVVPLIKSEVYSVQVYFHCDARHLFKALDFVVWLEIAWKENRLEALVYFKVYYGHISCRQFLNLEPYTNGPLRQCKVLIPLLVDGYLRALQLFIFTSKPSIAIKIKSVAQNVAKWTDINRWWSCTVQVVSLDLVAGLLDVGTTNWGVYKNVVFGEAGALILSIIIKDSLTAPHYYTNHQDQPCYMFHVYLN